MNLQKGHMLCKQIDLPKFAERLVKEMGRPVIDMTQLPGLFSFALDWVRDNPIVPQTDDGIGLPLPQAIEAQLGLRLEKRNWPADVLVIDRVEKTPSDN